MNAFGRLWGPRVPRWVWVRGEAEAETLVVAFGARGWKVMRLRGSMLKKLRSLLLKRARRHDSGRARRWTRSRRNQRPRVYISITRDEAGVSRRLRAGGQGGAREAFGVCKIPPPKSRHPSSFFMHTPEAMPLFFSPTPAPLNSGDGLRRITSPKKVEIDAARARECAVSSHASIRRAPRRAGTDRATRRS